MPVHLRLVYVHSRLVYLHLVVAAEVARLRAVGGGGLEEDGVGARVEEEEDLISS